MVEVMVQGGTFALMNSEEVYHLQWSGIHTVGESYSQATLQ